MASNGFSKRHLEKIEIKSACFNILTLSLNGKKTLLIAERLRKGLESTYNYLIIKP